MILVVGGIAAGKRTYVQGLGYVADGFADAVLDNRTVVFNAQELARAASDDEVVVQLADQLTVKDVVVFTEVGSGIVPLDPDERAFRERAGRLAAQLAERADAVVRLVCGIPQVLKGEVPGVTGVAAAVAGSGSTDDAALRQPLELSDEQLELVIIRHGQTPGNDARQYVGVLDHPLSERGRQEALQAGVHPEVDKVYVTPLVRTHETASICFPQARQVVVDGLQEMDFGVFAGRSADDMADDPDYLAWVDGNCEGTCPGGESRAQFTRRICQALARLLNQALARGEKRVILVAHGGTMMSALSTYAVDHGPRKYYEWLTGNCQGYRIRATVSDDGTLVLGHIQRFANLDFL